MPPIGLPQPVGKNGLKLASWAAGTAMMMNAVSATTLISTSTALTLADLEVPITSRPVITSAMVNARMLNAPPSIGPVLSAIGSSIPALASRPFM